MFPLPWHRFVANPGHPDPGSCGHSHSYPHAVRSPSKTDARADQDTIAHGNDRAADGNTHGGANGRALRNTGAGGNGRAGGDSNTYWPHTDANRPAYQLETIQSICYTLLDCPRRKKDGTHLRL